MTRQEDPPWTTALVLPHPPYTEECVLSLKDRSNLFVGTHQVTREEEAADYNLDSC